MSNAWLIMFIVYFKVFVNIVKRFWSSTCFQENGHSLPEHDDTLLSLASMGYSVEEASAAMERCGALLILT